MSSSDRRSLLGAMGLSVLALSGCLRPLLAKGGGTVELRGKIGLPPVRDRFGYFLDDSLVDRLGRPEDIAYQLTLVTVIEEAGVAISADNSATRINIVLQSSWQLVRLSDGQTVLSGDQRLQSGYNSTSSLYATRQTRLDVERRLARELAERIARSIQARAARLVV